MYPTLRTPKSRSIARHRIATAAVALLASLAFAASASAQTSFQANVAAHNPLPKPCPNNEFICGTADTNYGPATWTFDLTNLTPISNACDAYQATVTFELADTSTLVLAETGTACAPGNSNSAPTSTSFGHPNSPSGSWTVQSANGQFDGLTGATGTDTLNIAGAHASGSYTQTP